jgi:hypothetical protein
MGIFKVLKAKLFFLFLVHLLNYIHFSSSIAFLVHFTSLSPLILLTHHDGPLLFTGY